MKVFSFKLSAMRFLKIIFMLSALAITQLSNAQKHTITGKVTDASTGSPLSNVSIKIKSGNGAITSADGSFSVSVQHGDVLEISYIGYATQTFIVGNEVSLSVQLQPALSELSEFVTVGTRSAGRIKTETPVPIDVVNVSRSALPTARMGITVSARSILQQALSQR